MLISTNLFGTVNKIEKAIKLLQENEPPEGYRLQDSGGKDSGAILKLAELAGVKFEAHHQLTTVDPPELVRFLKKTRPNTIINRPKLTMWRLIPKKTLPPSRFIRYCCDVLKEQGGEKGATIITGVRAEESYKRAQRDFVETFKGKTHVRPIFDWTEADVWEFHEKYNIPYCELYDEGFSRLGCVGCPLANYKHREYEFKRWPKIYNAYIRAFDRMIEERKRRDMPCTWKTGQEVMDWWLYGKQEFNDGGLFND